ncbi:ABC transporter permease subunit [Roseovarius sp. SK2]|uniref:ABC transporter permease subunit n=1 Tax=Roseovarius sp. SK2 TaxID=3028381 RepID=UPI00237A2144|nr:ABC transporter permease subunit [Roseovarius sp. SK2]MDD9727706.1 ABC transporter permease subunit [Roseovarius sp. SK2]
MSLVNFELFRPVRGPATRREHQLYRGAVIAAAAVVTLLGLHYHWLRDVPAALEMPVAEWLNAVMAALVAWLQPVFRWLSWLLSQPMKALQAGLAALPWITVAVVFAGLAWLASGPGLAVFAGVGLMLTVVLGYWIEMMNTLALVGVSVPLSVALGFGLGAAGFAWPRWRRGLEFMLDLMQTVPAFAYLIPILLLFGFGPVVGLIASAIYAAPPMVRNTMLGLARVPDGQVESGRMAGCSRAQLFWLVRVPGAMPQLMVGINQSTMQALSMVIIAAIIGGFDDIGWAVLTALRKAQFGQSLMAGLCIVFLAVMIDRITHGFADRVRERRGHAAVPVLRRRWVLVAMAAAASLPVGLMVAQLNAAPTGSVWDVAAPLNAWLEQVLIRHGAKLAAFKTQFFYLLMFPSRAGLENAVTPFTWGIALTPGLIGAYWAAAVVLSLALARRSLALGCGVLFVFYLMYFGTTGVSWVALTLLLTALGGALGGGRTAMLCAGSCLYFVVTGLWDLAMLSIYLCAMGVVISLALGAVIGGLAAHSRRMSGVVRIVVDTLQTMPQFVLLIPFLMFFQVGEFTALLAIVIYAVVPAIRYTEYGLRTVDEDIVEAARQMGCTPWQILLQVRVPMALPSLALGINQTIMFGLAMLAITALVGTQDLGQAVYVALSQADPGKGLLAGLGIALIALTSDRLIRGWIAQLRRGGGQAQSGADASGVTP